MNPVICPYCSHNFGNQPKWQGALVRCSQCRNQFQIAPSQSTPNVEEEEQTTLMPTYAKALLACGVSAIVLAIGIAFGFVITNVRTKDKLRDQEAQRELVLEKLQTAENQIQKVEGQLGSERASKSRVDRELELQKQNYLAALEQIKQIKGEKGVADTLAKDLQQKLSDVQEKLRIEQAKLAEAKKEDEKIVEKRLEDIEKLAQFQGCWEVTLPLENESTAFVLVVRDEFYFFNKKEKKGPGTMQVWGTLKLVSEIDTKKTEIDLLVPKHKEDRVANQVFESILKISEDGDSFVLAFEFELRLFGEKKEEKPKQRPKSFEDPNIIPFTFKRIK